ncbi:enoyl-CoA hydratase/isomerase family protein [Anianabacter salinae]|uniref:enoyl-CoA hydratase/isomerase family protein n=1 Tax=Anianabacter salinae TaxID=2851023 RepID=UPI00225E08E9|nr:enoyl-CoA hydratase/isomerase family protein [Anianabacter salinae]MBV0913789.1 enoyl-CoA hydratase/isomerase family protein [Anianabacter salinae]
MTGDLVSALQSGRGTVTLALTAPRAAALTPEVLDALRAALDTAERSAPHTLFLTGGRNFCSGGDVARFLQAADSGEARDYARRVVPALQEIVLRLYRMPATVAVAARGAITGGGAGFLFAADCAVLAPEAFVQPYYGRVGFAPDGGWTALLPGRIGHARAGAWIAGDHRHGAESLRQMGLCNDVSPSPEAAIVDLLGKTGADTRIATKALLRDDAHCAGIEARLKAETEAFLDRIDRPDVRRGMAAFVARNHEAADV